MLSSALEVAVGLDNRLQWSSPEEVAVVGMN
jgi:hypothetical protein